MYPVHTTIRPIAMIAREAKPDGAKESRDLYSSPPSTGSKGSKGLGSNPAIAFDHAIGAIIRSAIVKWTLETATAS
jgi:hypothetical protein